jgi:IS4 transposase
MDLDMIYGHFCDQSPLPVMARITLEHAVQDDLLDQLFREKAQKQYEGDLLFSAVVRLMLLVSCSIRPSVCAAYQRNKQQIGVSLASVYNKLQGIETPVSRALVRETAERLAEVASHLNADLPLPFPGYENRILDGSHLEASHHRIQETRKMAAGPLPGLGLVVLDPARRMVVDYIPEVDGHAQERSLLEPILDELEARQVWIADRNFCTTVFLWQVHASGAFFVIRQHATNVRWRATGAEKRAGSVETGTVYEQPIEILDGLGNRFTARRVRMVLNEKTRDGDRELLILSNLPAEVTAQEIAEGYRQRWTIESAFAEIRRCLNAEINGLGYPQAALFSFAMGLLAFNVLSVLAAAMRAAHGQHMQEEFSTQQAAEEISAMWSGMHVLLTGRFWRDKFGGCSSCQIARELKRLAAHVDVRRFKKAKRRPRAPTPKRKHLRGKPHVSTARIIHQRK